MPTEDLIQLVQTHFERSEKELRSITFKSQETITELLNQVRQQARALAADRHLGVIDQIVSQSSVQIKNQIAQALANLCPEKYPDRQNLSFFQLQDTHQTLAETIYLEWLHASLQVGGNLSLPASVPAIRRPGVRVTLLRDMPLKDALGNEMRFQKGERCYLFEQNDRLLLQKLIPKKDPNPKKQAKLEPWPHLFLLPDRRLIQESGPRWLEVERPWLEVPVKSDDVYVFPLEKAALHVVCYALARNIPGVLHGMIKRLDDRILIQLQTLSARDASYQPVLLALDRSLPESNPKQALWVLWLEKAVATHKGNYDARFDSRELASLFLGRGFRVLDVSPVGQRDWQSEHFLKGLPAFVMHPWVIQYLSERGAKYPLESAQIGCLTSLNSTEIQYFKRWVVQNNPLLWQNWQPSQHQLWELDTEQKAAEADHRNQYQQQAEAIKSRADLSPTQIKNELAQLSLSFDTRLKKMRAETKARRAQLEPKVQQEQQVFDQFILDLQRLTRTQGRREGLEALLKNSMSFTKLKYRSIMYQQDFENVLSELTKYAETHPEIQLETSKFRSQELLSMLTAYVQDILPDEADSYKGMAPNYSPYQQKLFKALEQAIIEGQIILAGNSPPDSEMPGHQQFIYPIVDTLAYQGRLCVRMVHPLAQEFPRYFKMHEGKLGARTALHDAELAAIEAKMAKSLPEFWVDIQDLGGYFRTLYMSL